MRLGGKNQVPLTPEQEAAIEMECRRIEIEAEIARDNDFDAWMEEQEEKLREDRIKMLKKAFSSESEE